MISDIIFQTVEHLYHVFLRIDAIDFELEGCERIGKRKYQKSIHYKQNEECRFLHWVVRFRPNHLHQRDKRADNEGAREHARDDERGKVFPQSRERNPDANPDGDEKPQDNVQPQGETSPHLLQGDLSFGRNCLIRARGRRGFFFFVRHGLGVLFYHEGYMSLSAPGRGQFAGIVNEPQGSQSVTDRLTRTPWIAHVCVPFEISDSV